MGAEITEMEDMLFKFNEGAAAIATILALAVYLMLYRVFRHISLRFLIASHALASFLAVFYAIPCFTSMPLPPFFSSSEQFHSFERVCYAVMLIVDFIGSCWFIVFLMQKVRQLRLGADR